MENTLPPLLGDLTPKTARAYVYAITMWAENVGGKDYLHIVESDKLKSKAGRDLADRAADYLAVNLVPGRACDPFSLIDHIGRAYIAERASQGFGPPQKKRDPNVTGAAFETSLQVIIGKLCDVTPSRTPDLHTLQGFELAPVGYHSKPDLVLFGPRDFRLLISTKRTLRKERIGTYLHESYFYRRRRPDLQIAFGVNEFQPNILRHLSTDPLVDRVYPTSTSGCSSSSMHPSPGSRRARTCRGRRAWAITAMRVAMPASSDTVCRSRSTPLGR